MADYVSKDMINKAMQVDLLEYAKSLGMEFETRGSNNTLYQKGHSLNITRSKNMYYRFSTGTGGNVINFAMEQNGWTFQQAVRALCGEEIQKSVPKQTYTPAKQIPEHKEKMILPKANSDARRAFAYLVKTRHIDSQIVSQLMREHKIYEGIEYLAKVKVGDNTITAKIIGSLKFEQFQNSNLIANSKEKYGLKLGYNDNQKLQYIGMEEVNSNQIAWYQKKGIFKDVSQIYNCVFVGYDKNGQAGYASVRSTYTMGNSYRGDVKNSDKRHCFTLNGKSDSVYVFEAPIDAMSHATLTKVSGWDWQEDWRIALGGVSDLGLQQFLSLHPEIKNIHFATDNDEQGKKVLENEYNTDGIIKKVGYMQKYKDKGYEVFREEPAHKDFNEDLCAFMEEQTPIQEDMSL